MVFAPDTSSPSYRAQLQLIERHSFELSAHNTVVVPVSAGASAATARFSFENLPVTGPEEQAAIRARFHVQPGEFTVILLTQDGTEQVRSATPVDIHKLVARLDALDQVEQPVALDASLN
jgi:hypothetical protein